MLISDYSYLFVFLIVGVGFVLVNTLLPLIIAPRSHAPRSKSSYESGEVPVGAAWIQVDIYYYLLCLVFVAFDVELVLLVPVILAYGTFRNFMPFVELTVFLLILSLALAYAWRKGVFRWK